MGGKTWNKAEELIFWRTIIPQSPQAANMSDRLKSWNQCAAIMQEMMGRPKRRIYTKTMLCTCYLVSHRQWCEHGVTQTTPRRTLLSEHQNKKTLASSTAICPRAYAGTRYVGQNPPAKVIDFLYL